MTMTDPLPIECRARLDTIIQRSIELSQMFYLGNRNDTLAALLAMEPKAALAVLARMMASSTRQSQEGLMRYLEEVA
jgi:hypothetical protein